MIRRSVRNSAVATKTRRLSLTPDTRVGPQALAPPASPKTTGIDAATVVQENADDDEDATVLELTEAQKRIMDDARLVNLKYKLGRQKSLEKMRIEVATAANNKETAS